MQDNKEDFELFKFAVDIPKFESDEWFCCEYFETKEEALKYAKEKFGADENGMVCLISNI